MARSRTQRWVKPQVEELESRTLLSGSPTPVGLLPSQVAHAYRFDQIRFAGGMVQGDGAGQTIAIVDPFDDPNIAGDLRSFDADPRIHLPDPPSFRKVGQDGGAPPTVVDPSGRAELEIALDVEWAHALAPRADIVLVEANSLTSTDYFAAINTAASLPGVTVVSMSVTFLEFADQTGFDSSVFAAHPGVTFVASSGDQGPMVNYPAVSPYVLAVGGTKLTLDAANNYVRETPWRNTGGGTSTQEVQPSFQRGIGTPSGRAWRTVPDVAFDGDPSSGVAVYDTFNNYRGTPWWSVLIGGTSFGAPAWAALIAIADQGRSLLGLDPLDGYRDTLPKLYAMDSSNFHVLAANGSYDTTTGRGSPIADRVVDQLLQQPVPHETFVVQQADHQVYGRKLGADGQPIGGFFLAAPGQVKEIQVGHDLDHRPVLFVLGLDNQVYALSFDATGNPVGGYFATSASGAQFQSITLNTDASGRPLLFGLGADQQIYEQRFVSNSRPNGDFTVTAPGQVQSFSVGHDAGNRPELFVIGLDNQVYALPLDSVGNPRGGYFLAAAGQVLSLSVGHAGTRPELFVIGLDNQVYALPLDSVGNPTGGYYATSGNPMKALAVSNDLSGHPLVFALGLDGQVYEQRFDAQGNPSSGFVLVSTTSVQALSVSRDAAGHATLFVLGLDNQVYQQFFDADGNPTTGDILQAPGIS
jgi:hypothetical protein